MTVHDPIDFICGDSWEETGPLQDVNGLPLSLAGATVVWKLDFTDPVTLITTNALSLALGSGITVLDAPSATILVKVSAAQSAPLKPGLYVDWLQVTLSDGTVLTEWTGSIRAAAGPV